MKLSNINSEDNLRKWLSDHIDICDGRLKLEWFESGRHPRSVGVPDAQISCESQTIGIELKYLIMTRTGIKWTLRPVQRRYHRMTAIHGGKSAVLAYIASDHKLFLLRGDMVPLRDYASDPDSGCKNGKIESLWQLNYHSIDEDRQAIWNLEQALFNDDDFWKKEDEEYG